MSLTLRLVAWVVALLAVVLGALGVGLWTAVSAWTLEAQDGELARAATRIAAAVEVKRSGALELDEDEAGGTPFRISTLEGRVLLQTPFNWPAAPAGAGFSTAQTRTGAPLRLLVRTFEPEHAERLGTPPPALRLEVAAPTAALTTFTGRFQWGLVAALVAALLFGALGAWGLSRSALSPLRRLADEAAAIEAHSVHRRLAVGGLAPELKRLGGAFNGVLQRLEAAFLQQQQFIARASHALRTPLASILAQAEVTLRRERSALEYRTALEEIAASAREAGELSAQLLALSRADLGAAELRREPVELAAFCAELQRAFDARTQAAGVAFRLEVPEGLRASVDRLRLRELLDVLIDNALQYGAGGGEIGLRVGAVAEELELEVWDRGPGVPAEERPLLFERFYRGTAANRSSRPGSGLGLAIAQAIARAHGGRIEIASAEGGGASFRVRLPLSSA